MKEPLIERAVEWLGDRLQALRWHLMDWVYRRQDQRRQAAEDVDYVWSNEGEPFRPDPVSGTFTNKIPVTAMPGDRLKIVVTTGDDHELIGQIRVGRLKAQ